MTVATWPVHPALRQCLAGPMVAYDLTLPVEAAHVGVPSTAATVIIAVETPLDVGWLDDPGLSTNRWCSISGLHLKPALVQTHGLQRGIQLAVTATGCRSLFGAPLACVAGQTVDLAELPRGITSAEHAAVADQPTWTMRLAVLEQLLLRRLALQQPPADLARGWGLMSDGWQVGKAAAELGWSRRHLATRMRAEFGIGPKELGRLARFHRARVLVLGGCSLAQAAHACGFADQSHLSREWKAFSGRGPRDSREEFPNLHDLLPAQQPDSTA